MTIIRATSEWADRESRIKIRLRSYRDLVRRQAACQDLMDQLYPRLTATVTADRVMAQPGNLNEDKAIRRLDLESSMKASLDRMKQEAVAILGLIESLPPEEYVVLFRRYILNEDMEKVSAASHLSIASCWRAHRRGINRLAEKLIVIDSEVIAH